MLEKLKQNLSDLSVVIGKIHEFQAHSFNTRLLFYLVAVFWKLMKAFCFQEKMPLQGSA